MSSSAVQAVVDLVQAHPVITNRKTDGRMIALKNEAWEKIAEDFNAMGFEGGHRKLKQLKRIWDRIKSKAKTEHDMIKRETKKTGGGIPPPVYSDTTAKVLGTIQDEVYDIGNDFDSDSQITFVTGTPSLVSASTRPSPPRAEGGALPYISEGLLSYPVGGSFHYQEPHRTMATHLDFHSPDYGPPHYAQGSLSPDNGPPQYGRLSLYKGPPQHDPLSLDYGLPQHARHSSYNGPPAPYFPEDHTFHSGPLPYYNHGPSHGDGFHSHDPAYQHELDNLWHLPAQEYFTEESEFGAKEEEEEDDEGEEEDDGSVTFNSLEEALQEVSVQLPRLAVTAPPSLLPPRGGGLCCLPNLGNTCYLSSVLQCLYHTPGLPVLLAQTCEGLSDRSKGRNIVAHTLNSLMTKMDDVKKLKRGVLAYFKGVCGLQDEQFASEEQQEAHNLLAGLLLWLHQDLASQVDVDCACTKSLMKKQSAATTTTATTTTNRNNNKKKHHSTQQGTTSHHPHQTQNSYGSNHHQSSNNHFYHHQQLHEKDSIGPSDHYHNHQHYNQGSSNYTKPSDPHHNHHHQNSSKDQQVPKKASKAPLQLKGGREGEVCGRCGVTYQSRSFISDMFEGIRQQDIICPKGGIILNTTWERFTSLSLPVSGSSEITLEEALQQYFKICMFMWDCEYCGSSHPCHQQTRILCAPPILILHLSRYTDRRNPRKQNVIFPIDGLSLQDHMKFTKDRVQQYGLYGVCNHYGTMQQGHYTACCRASRVHGKQGSWYDFDDEELSRVTHFRHPREAHILFYSAQGFEAMHP